LADQGRAQQELPVVDASLVARCCIRIMDMIMWRAAKSRYGAGKKPSEFSIVCGVEHAFTLLDVTHEVTPGERSGKCASASPFLR